MEKKEKDRFDYANFEKEAIEKLKNGTELGGRDGILAPMLSFALMCLEPGLVIITVFS